MKKLVSTETIEQAHAAHQLKLELAAGQIVTPQARERAEQLGVELVESVSLKVGYRDMQKIVDEVLSRLKSPNMSRAKVEKAVRDILKERE